MAINILEPSERQLRAPALNWFSQKATFTGSCKKKYSSSFARKVAPKAAPDVSLSRDYHKPQGKTSNYEGGEHYSALPMELPTVFFEKPIWF